MQILKHLQVYEPVEEGSYIKMIDMVSGSGGQLQVCVNSLSMHVKIYKVLFPWVLLLTFYFPFVLELPNTNLISQSLASSPCLLCNY
jgi:hypothetical protein